MIDRTKKGVKKWSWTWDSRMVDRNTPTWVALVYFPSQEGCRNMRNGSPFQALFVQEVRNYLGRAHRKIMSVDVSVISLKGTIFLSFRSWLRVFHNCWERNSPSFWFLTLHNPEDGGCMFLQNINIHLQDCMVSQQEHLLIVAAVKTSELVLRENFILLLGLNNLLH
jgi:hypothetical protein